MLALPARARGGTYTSRGSDRGNGHGIHIFIIPIFPALKAFPQAIRLLGRSSRTAHVSSSHIVPQLRSYRSTAPVTQLPLFRMSKRKPAQNVEIADDDDELSLQSADKPGFIAWAEALETRISSDVRHSCVGRWLPSDHAVELLQTRGKMHSSMGFARGSARLLHPEEALYLIDEGGLVIVKPPGWKDPHAPPATSAQSTSAPVGNSEGGEAAVAQNAVNASCEPVSLDSAAKPERSDTSAVDGETHEEPAAKRAKIDASRSDDGPSVADIATEPVPGSLHGGESSAILHSAIVPDDAKRLAVSTTELGAPAEDAPMADSSVACSASDDNAPASSSEPPAGPAPASSATATVIEGMVAASEPTATSEAPAPATARPAPPPYKPFYKPDPTQGAGALPLQAAYELLLRHCSLGQYLAYSQLRAQGLLVFRHRKSWGGAAAPSASSSSGPGAGMAPTLLLPSGEPALQVTYDVYVRDGITNFKPSAPGPPDFFLLVVHR